MSWKRGRHSEFRSHGHNPSHGYTHHIYLTFDTVIAPLMALPIYKTNPLVCQAKHMQHCSTDPVVREAAANKATPAFAAAKKDSKRRKDVYAKVKKYSESAEAATLNAYEAHFVRSILDGFERGGLGLDKNSAAELSKLLEADVDACNKYKRNLGEDATKLEFDEKDLEGCDDAWIADKKTAGTGKIVLTLKYPDVLPVLQNCCVAETRKKIVLAREKAYGNNLDLVAEGVTLRKKTAAILGYPSWAHFVTKTRMSGSPEKVQSFLGGIRDMAAAKATEDKEILRKLKASHLLERGEIGGGAVDSIKLEAWDSAFYHSLLLKRDYGVDHEAIRKYFPCGVVVEGTLAIYQDLLGLKFTELINFDSWHPDVRLFIVHDRESNEKIYLPL